METCAIQNHSRSPYALEIAEQMVGQATTEPLVVALLAQTPGVEESLATREQLQARVFTYLKTEENLLKIADAFAKVYSPDELEELVEINRHPAVLRHQELQRKLAPPHGIEIGQTLVGAIMESCQKAVAESPADEQKVTAAKKLVENSQVIILDAENFAEEVEECDIPVLVDAYATWCGPCKMMEPHLHQLSQEMAGVVKFGKFDVDAQQKLMERFQIRAMPTLLLFRGGELVERHQGAMDKERLEQWLAAKIA